MIKKALLALMLALGMTLSVVQPASALGGYNLVNNSGYSNQPILVCGSGTCATLQPGGSAYEATFWSPDSVAVCPYCIAQYRAVVGNHYTTGWVEQRGSRYGTWIDAKAVIQMWGGKDVMVQVVMTGPFY